MVVYERFSEHKKFIDSIFQYKKRKIMSDQKLTNDGLSSMIQRINRRAERNGRYCELCKVHHKHKQMTHLTRDKIKIVNFTFPHISLIHLDHYICHSEFLRAKKLYDRHITENNPLYGSRATRTHNSKKQIHIIEHRSDYELSKTLEESIVNKNQTSNKDGSTSFLNLRTAHDSSGVTVSLIQDAMKNIIPIQVAPHTNLTDLNRRYPPDFRRLLALLWGYYSNPAYTVGDIVKLVLNSDIAGNLVLMESIDDKTVRKFGVELACGYKVLVAVLLKSSEDIFYATDGGESKGRKFMICRMGGFYNGRLWKVPVNVVELVAHEKGDTVVQNLTDQLQYINEVQRKLKLEITRAYHFSALLVDNCSTMSNLYNGALGCFNQLVKDHWVADKRSGNPPHIVKLGCTDHWCNSASQSFHIQLARYCGDHDIRCMISPSKSYSDIIHWMIHNLINRLRNEPNKSLIITLEVDFGLPHVPLEKIEKIRFCSVSKGCYYVLKQFPLIIYILKSTLILDSVLQKIGDLLTLPEVLIRMSISAIAFVRVFCPLMEIANRSNEVGVYGKIVQEMKQSLCIVASSDQVNRNFLCLPMQHSPLLIRAMHFDNEISSGYLDSHVLC